MLKLRSTNYNLRSCGQNFKQLVTVVIILCTLTQLFNPMYIITEILNEVKNLIIINFYRQAVAYLGGGHAAMPPPLGKSETFFDEIHC